MHNVSHLSDRDLEALQNATYVERLQRLERTRCAAESEGCGTSPMTAGSDGGPLSTASDRPIRDYGKDAQTKIGVGGRITEEVSLENVDELMRYQPWDREQVAAGDVVRETLIAAVRAILRQVPRCPSRTKAINHLVDARMDANAAISFRGRF